MPDSPDSATRQNDNIHVVGQVRSFENLVDPTRRVQFHGVALVDNPSVLSERLAEEVTKKAFKLVVSVLQLDDQEEVKSYECQVGLLRQGTLDDFVVRPVTAKHNVANGEVEGVVERYRSAVLRIPKTGIQRDINTTFPDGGCDYIDHNECDIAWAEPVRNFALVDSAASFQCVRRDFQCCAGQKVAIAVYSENAVTSEAASAPKWFSEADLAIVYGSKNHVNILTGTITRVGPDRISYDINTYGGCSGAVVFLLDKEQPGSVTTEDYGRAIAVHSGPCPDQTPGNLAFLLSALDQ
jgi:hypothetical protein